MPETRGLSARAGGHPAPEAAVRQAARHARLPVAGVLRLGSWTALVRFRASFFADALPPLFRGCFQGTARTGAVGAVDAVLHLLDGDDVARARPTVPRQFVEAPVLRRVAPGTWEFTTNHVAARVFVDERPVTVVLWLQEPPPWPGQADYVHHFLVALHKILLLLERMYLHAGAVRIRTRVSVFVGDKGAGKSTVCLALGRAGATVLADDHVLLARSGGRYLVSGCHASARVTPKTEGWLFADPLPIVPEELGGMLKKEFPVARFFRAEPRRDRPIHGLFFLRGSDRLGLAPLSRQEALRRLVEQTAWSHPFIDADDHVRYLGYLADLVASVPAAILDLSPDLDDLARLVPLLARAGGPAHDHA